MGVGCGLYTPFYDRDSAIIARRGLAETLEIAAQTKASGIVIVGHSMGAVVVMEALRTLSADKRLNVLKRIKGVLLAAPDLDPDLFRSQIDDIDYLPQPFTIVVSGRDRALDISRRLAGARHGSVAALISPSCRTRIFRFLIFLRSIAVVIACLPARIR